MAYRVTKGKAPPFPAKLHDSPLPIAKFDQHIVLYELFPEQQSKYGADYPENAKVVLDDDDSVEESSTPVRPNHAEVMRDEDGRPPGGTQSNQQDHGATLTGVGDLPITRTNTVGNRSMNINNESITLPDDDGSHDLPLDEIDGNQQAQDVLFADIGELPMTRMNTIGNGSMNLNNTASTPPGHKVAPAERNGKPKEASDENDRSNAKADGEGFGTPREESMELEYPIRDSSVLSVSWVRSSPPILPSRIHSRDCSSFRGDWDDDEVIIPDSEDKRQRERFTGRLKQSIEQRLRDKIPQPTLREMLARLSRQS